MNLGQQSGNILTPVVPGKAIQGLGDAGLDDNKCADGRPGSESCSKISTEAAFDSCYVSW